MIRTLLPALAIAFVLPTLAALAEGYPRPLGVVLSQDGTSAWVAQQRDASLTAVDLESGHTQQWAMPAKLLHDFTVWTDRAMLVLADDPAVILRLDRTTQPPQVTGRWTGVEHATRVRGTPDGHRLAAASLTQRWIKLADEVQLVAGEDVQWQHIAVPFSPGEILWLPDQRHLLVADAFGSRLGVIDAAAGQLLSVREIPGHNISGLALETDGRNVLLTHQSIHRGAETSRDHVHWGGILTNVLRSIRVADVLDAHAGILDHTVIVHLGDIGRGAGDPAGIAVRSDGVRVVSLAGVNELTFGGENGLEWKRVEVGSRPRSFALTADGKQAIVLNELDNSLSIVPLDPANAEVRTISLAEPIPLSPADRGERLFYSARLSHDGWFSCHSCHTNGHSNGQLVDNFTDGSIGTPKRVLTLRGVRDTAPYGWDGHLATLGDQVRHSVTSTMQGPEPTDNDVNDLAAFLESLPPWPQAVGIDAEQPAIVRGQVVFERENCVRCHAPQTLTTPATYDVGLLDERGVREFNPPSLRGLKHGGPYFHHGRAETLEHVLGEFQHQLRQPLSPADQADLLKYLRSL